MGNVPVLGAMIGVSIGARSADKNIDDWKALLIGAALGAVAGCLVFLLDRPSSASETDSEESGFENHSARVLPRFLTFLSLALIWAPVVGNFVAMIAVAVNWHAAGSRRKLSILGLILSLPITLFMLYVVSSPRRRI